LANRIRQAAHFAERGEIRRQKDCRVAAISDLLNDLIASLLTVKLPKKAEAIQPEKKIEIKTSN
jgi:hypothetical protein